MGRANSASALNRQGGEIVRCRCIRTRLSQLVGVMLIASSVYGAPAAGADPIGCGSTIMTDTILTHDIGPCPGHGIVIGASNITLDLNGHRVFGVPEVNQNGSGIFLVNRSNVVIRNGTVSHFDKGIELVVGVGVLMTDLTVVDNVAPNRGGAGVLLGGARASTLRNSVVARNGPASGVELVSAGATHNIIEGNSIVNNGISLSGAGRQVTQGILLLEALSTTIRNNLIAQNGNHGIQLTTNSSGNVISGNRIVGNGYHTSAVRERGDGVQVGLDPVRRVPDPFPPSHNRIEGNTVIGNAASGISIANKANTVAGNTALGNGYGLNALNGPAHDLFDRESNYEDCDNNVWSGNKFLTAFPDCAKG